jgi:GntR family transcriptional regulator
VNMTTVDKTSPIPAYFQIYQYIKNKVSSNEWQIGMQIPTERELTELFGVSRMTVRHAFTILAQEGIVLREVGKGSFIAEPKINQTLRKLTGFSEDMLAQGKKPSTKVLEAGYIEAEPFLAEKFKIPVGARVFRLKRLRLADNKPMCLETVYLTEKNSKGLMDEDLSQSLYSLLREKMGVIPVRAKQQIQAGLSTRDEANLLRIGVGDAVLRLTRYTFDENNEQIEIVISAYRGDLYVFDVELVALEG